MVTMSAGIVPDHTQSLSMFSRGQRRPYLTFVAGKVDPVIQGERERGREQKRRDDDLN